jgi:hypothetical protein
VAVGCESRSQFQQFVLPYEAVRTAAVGPDRVAREFLQSTYEAAAELGKRDRAALEVDPDRWQHRLP